MTADDDDLDDASLKSMRAVWLSMRDEEPPAAGMSGLLAAAAAKAEAMRAKPSWWERVIAVLRRPPALAFATVLVLIGGAVLVTRTSEDATPSMKSDAPAPELAPEPTVVSPVATPPEPSPVREVEAKPDEPARGGDGDIAVAKPRPSRTHATGKRKSRAQQYKEEAAALEQQDQAGAVGMAGAGADDVPATSFPAEGGTRSTTKRAKDSVARPERDVRDDREELARQAVRAAERGDCAQARALAKRIAAADASYYRAKIANHATIAKCL